MSSYYLVSVLESFLAAGLLVGLGWSVRRHPSPWRFTLILLAAGAAGLTTGRLLPSRPVFLLGVAAAQVVLWAIFVTGLRLRPVAAGLAGSAAMVAAAALRWGRDPNLAALTATSVVNTDFLLNLTALVLAFALIVFAAWQLCRLGGRLPRWRWFLLGLLSLCYLTPLAGQIVLALLRLRVWPLTKESLTFAALTTNFPGLLTYAAIAAGLIVLLAGAWLVVRPLRRAWAGADGDLSRRKALAEYRQARFLVAGGAVALLVLAAGQAYWDGVASRPLRISSATPVQSAADGQVHLPLADLMDGRLHRFEWVSGDLKVVRFWVINRHVDRVSPAVVFDACALCGDKGYVLRDDRVVCVACGVQLFVPSVGKAGGCNPIPMEGWTAQDSEILIPSASLEKGAPFFSATQDKEVTDPVSGKKFSSARAAHSFRYEGRTYFFLSNETYETFRADPAKYHKLPCCSGS